MRITKDTKISYKRGRYLYIFLKERGLYEKYLFYMIQDKKEQRLRRIPDPKDKLSLLYAMDTYVFVSAFTWSKTPEGWAFWHNINQEFSINWYQLKNKQL